MRRLTPNALVVVGQLHYRLSEQDPCTYETCMAGPGPGLGWALLCNDQAFVHDTMRVQSVQGQHEHTKRTQSFA